MGLLDQFADFVKTPEGVGLLSGLAGWAANARRGTPWNNVGRGAMAGLVGYGNAQDQQMQMDQAAQSKQLREMQLRQLKQAEEDAQAMRSFDPSQFFMTPQQQAIGAAGPTPEAAAMIPNLQPKFDQKAMVAALLASQNPALKQKGLELAVKDTVPIKLGKDEKLLEPGTYRTIAQNLVPEKTPVEKMLDAMGVTDPTERAKWMQGALTKATTHAPASSATVHLPPMENEENKKYGQWLGETHANFMNAGMTAPGKLKQLERMQQLLQGVDGGKLAPIGLDIASAGKAIGLNIDPKLGNKEAAQALANEMAGAYRQPGTGPMTDKDFENFLKRVPDLSKSAQGRMEIMNTLRSAYKRDIEAAKLAREYRKKNKTLDGFDEVLADFYARNPVVGAQPGQWKDL